MKAKLAASCRCFSLSLGVVLVSVLGQAGSAWAGGAPVANPQTVTLAENSPQVITLTGSDPNGNALNYTVLNGPSNGALSGTAPYLTYTPGMNFAGADSFSFKVNNGLTDSVPAVVTISVVASTVLFFDDFGGPTLNPIWQAALPNGQSGPTPEYYTGAPNYGFQSLGGISVLRLTNTLAPETEVGWSTVSNFTALSFRYEARFNTMTQGSSTSIDAFIEIWIIDAANSNRWDMAVPFGGNYGATHVFFANSSIDDTLVTVPFNFQNNTYYRLVLQGAPGQNIRASVLDDSGVELAGSTFAHDTSAFPSGFRIGLSQAIGTPIGSYPVDVAVDYVNLSSPGALAPSIVYPPVSQTVDQSSNVTFSVIASGTPTLAYQWLYDDTNVIAGATNASLALTNLQFGEAGSYSVLVTNASGSIVSADAILTVVAVAPSITSQPVGATVNPGGTATFTVIASGTATLMYQWLFDGSNAIAGATNASLTLTNIQTIAAGVYSVTVSNIAGSVTSAGAVLKVNQAPTANPQTVNLSENTAQPITLTGLDPNGYPLSYVVLSGPTNGTLSGSAPNLTYLPATNYAGTDAFTFKVNDGQLDSQVATVSLNVSANTVLFFDDFNGPTLNPMWQASLPNANLGSTVETYTGPASYVFTNVGGASAIRLNEMLNPRQLAGWSSATNFAASNFRYEARFNTLTQGGATSIDGFLMIWIIDAADSNRWDMALPYGGNFGANHSFFANSSIDTNIVNSPFNFQNNTFYRLVLEGGPGQNIRASVLDDTGVEITGFTFAHDTSVFPSGFKIGLSQCIGTPLSPFPVDVAVDYVNLTTSGATAPSIVLPPANQSVGLGSNVTFTVTASGSSVLAYQWIFDDTNILAGATNDSLTLTNIQLSQAGNYSVKVTNSLGSALSPDASLTVLTFAPTISAQPGNQTVLVGGSANFAVTASGSPSPTYQWLFDQTNPLSGATGSSLTLTNVQQSQAGTYSVVVSNVAGSVTSSNAALTVNVPPSVVQVVSTSVTSGILVVPINLLSQGDENTLQFSISFNPALLTLTGVAPGGGAADGSILANISQISSGRLGLLISLPPDETFDEGTDEIADVSFFVSPVTATNTVNIPFGDQPTARQVASPLPSILAANYSNGVVTIPPLGIEGDVFPIPAGDGSVASVDVVQEGLYVAGQETVTNAGEFQRADCAPRATLGDGVLTVSDWVQVGRYAAGLDPLVAQGGPAQNSGGDSQTAFVNGFASPAAQSENARTLTIVNAAALAGQSCRVPVQLNSQGDENGLEFSVAFNPSVLTYTSASVGSGAPAASMRVNTSQAGNGKLGVVMVLPATNTFGGSTETVANLNFAVAQSASANTAVSFSTSPLPQEVASANAETLPASYVNGLITITPRPTLNAAQSKGGVSFSWPVGAVGYGLEVCTNLSAPVWTSVSTTTVTNGGAISVTVSPSGPRAFYRLQHP